MPTRAKMTIISLYNYDNTIFDSFNVPGAMPAANIPAANKSVAVAQILIENAEFELMYPDIDFMKYAIAHWSAVNAKKWEKLWYTENISYDPIANVDALEKETHDLKYSRDLNYGVDDKGNYQGFNSSTYRNVSQQDAQNTEDGYTDDKGTITKERHGNIGVTSTQQLINQEREAADFSIYKVISDDFKKSFCCLVY